MDVAGTIEIAGCQVSFAPRTAILESVSLSQSGSFSSQHLNQQLNSTTFRASLPLPALPESALVLRQSCMLIAFRFEIGKEGLRGG